MSAKTSAERVREHRNRKRELASVEKYPAELRQQILDGRRRREIRQEAAAKANVAIGSVDADGNVDPRAPQLPKRDER